MMRTRSRRLATTTKLNLVPMLDMFTFVLIFLVVSFAPQEAKYRSHASLKLPVATSKVLKSSKLHLQLLGDDLILNGKPIKGVKINTANAEAWNQVKTSLQATSNERQAIVLSADRNDSFGRVDRLVAKLSSMGFEDIYFLAEQMKEELK